MAYKISDFTRPVAPSGDYPNGTLVDNPNGTEVNTVMMTDMLQLWQKLMADAGITPNSLPDNVTNGYQLYDALYRAYTSTGVVLSTVGGNTWTNFGAPYYNAAFKVAGNEVSLCGVVQITALVVGQPSILTLPVGAWPSSTTRFVAWVKIGATFQANEITVDTAGVVSMPSGVTSAGIVFLDGIRFRII